MSFVTRLFLWALTGGIMLVLVMVVWTIGPRIETQIYPVVGRLTITKMEAVDPYHTRIWVQFTKLRECKPIEVYWYAGTRDTLFERATYLVEKPLGADKYFNRPLGQQKSGPWLIGVPLADVAAGRVFSDAQHQCLPLWGTISRFYN